MFTICILFSTVFKMYLSQYSLLHFVSLNSLTACVKVYGGGSTPLFHLQLDGMYVCMYICRYAST